jgi:adenosylcobinamide kinase/adenosylcobinamide-phosphate guanylyltransferase
MTETTLIIGGARSGKSRFALELAEQKAPGEKAFLATCIPADAEMRERVARHRRERNPSWKTLEVPLDLAGALAESGRWAGIVLVDCLTLWANNLLFETQGETGIDRYVGDLLNAMEKVSCPVILVTNEVGTGIVPENPLARRFRDVTGRINQQVAAACSRVFWMVAGIPIPVKAPNRP